MLANDAINALRRCSLLVEMGAPTAVALDLGVAVGLPDHEMVPLLAGAVPSIPLPQLEEAIALRAPVWMPLCDWSLQSVETGRRVRQKVLRAGAAR